MGCDIHFYVEKYSNEDYIGPKDISEERDTKIGVITEDITLSNCYRWIPVDKWIYEDGYWNVPYNESFYKGRDYFLFSILADVRNDDTVVPISYPRGIPDDPSYPYKLISENWDGDGHSHSYFTLEELLNVDWDKYNTDEYGVDGFLETIEKMKGINADPCDIRCVFFFDN